DAARPTLPSPLRPSTAARAVILAGAISPSVDVALGCCTVPVCPSNSVERERNHRAPRQQSDLQSLLMSQNDQHAAPWVLHKSPSDSPSLIRKRVHNLNT